MPLASHQPLICVLIPTFRQGTLFENLVQQLVSSTYDRLHILISDDGSDDDSHDLIRFHAKKLEERFGSKNVEIFLHPKNLGRLALGNLNFLFPRIPPHAELFALNCGDGYPLPTRFEEQVPYLATHPDMDAVHSKILCLDSQGKTSLYWTPEVLIGTIGCSKLPTGDLSAYLRFNHCITNPSLLGPTRMLKECLDLEKFHKFKLAVIADYAFVLKASRRYRFGYIDRPLAVYRVLNESVGNQNRLAVV